MGGDFGEGIGGLRGRSLSTKHDVNLIAHTKIKNKLTSDLLAAASAAETSAARSTSHCARAAMTCVRSAAISASHLFLSATAASTSSSRSLLYVSISARHLVSRAILASSSSSHVRCNLFKS